jgi:hypothetical protein
MVALYGLQEMRSKYEKVLNSVETCKGHDPTYDQITEIQLPHKPGAILAWLMDGGYCSAGEMPLPAF